jgi:hypothetical protein
MMPLGVSNPSEDRVKVIEEELIRLKKELKQTTRQLSFLQVLFLIVTMVVGGGGYYLAKEGKLRIEGFSPEFATTINSKEFGLINRNNIRVVFDSDDKFGNPRITFLDPKLRLKMRLMVWPETQGGGGGLTFYDDSGNGWRGQFRLAENGTSLLSLRGDKQKGGIDASANFDGTSELKMFDKDGKGGIAMKVDSEGTPSLVLTDKDGKTIWRSPTTSPGSK